MSIKFYSNKEKYYEFSNFYMTDIKINGQVYPSSEHYYQAMKFNNNTKDEKDYIEYIRLASTPYKAYILARQKGRGGRESKYYLNQNDRTLLNDLIKKYKHVKMREDWDDIKISVMKRIIRYKFKDEKLKQLLLSTGGRELIEESPRDSFWGQWKGEGQNNLGKILMERREKLSN